MREQYKLQYSSRFYYYLYVVITRAQRRHLSSAEHKRERTQYAHCKQTHHRLLVAVCRSAQQINHRLLAEFIGWVSERTQAHHHQRDALLVCIFFMRTRCEKLSYLPPLCVHLPYSGIPHAKKPVSQTAYRRHAPQWCGSIVGTSTLSYWRQIILFAKHGGDGVCSTGSV